MSEQLNSQLSQENNLVKPSLLALLPFLAFMLFYLGFSIWAMFEGKDMPFYVVPMPVAFLVASAVAFLLNRRDKIGDQVEIYAKSMGEVNIMIMCLIFILAGIFASLAKGMGAVDAAVIISRNLIPGKLLLLGLFLVSCFISLAIGTSCGTIAAITPIAITLTQQLELSPALVIGGVVGGAMFGDNLSIISDTTIAATRTQGVAMRDKFLTNIWIAIPAAVVCIVVYLIFGRAGNAGDLPDMLPRHFILVLPYILILVCAVLGMNVMALLFLGSLLATIIGICCGTFDLWKAYELMSSGIMGMSETLIVALLAGGLLGLIRYNGGVAYLIEKIEKTISGQRGCEFGVLLLVCAVNLFTANNTVAIVIAGPIANTLSLRFGCEPKRIASILDATSCVVQGAIPYGAQILIAMGIVKGAGVQLGSFEVICCLYYPWALALSLIASILIQARRKQTLAPATK